MCIQACFFFFFFFFFFKYRYMPIQGWIQEWCLPENSPVVSSCVCIYNCISCASISTAKHPIVCLFWRSNSSNLSISLKVWVRASWCEPRNTNLNRVGSSLPSSVLPTCCECIVDIKKGASDLLSDIFPTTQLSPPQTIMTTVQLRAHSDLPHIFTSLRVISDHWSHHQEVHCFSGDVCCGTPD